MGKKLDALLGRNTKTSKLKTLATLATSRIAILKNQRNVRCSHARSDVIQLLNLNHQEHALLRVEHVIEEQNVLDAFVIIENYCSLLIDGVVLLENNRECPDELKEAISSSLIFAASRCGEFPELQKIREIFASSFGKEFAARAVELRNNCGVNPKIIQKLSTRQASLESRLKVLKQIASDDGITLYFEDDAPLITEEKKDVNGKQNQIEPMEDNMSSGPEVGEVDRDLYEITEEEKCAFELAAAAARAAVELYRSESWDEDPDDHSTFDHQRTPFNSNGSSKA